MGSVVPDASATAPLTSRHVCTREGNRRSCHKGSWAWNQWDASLWFADKWRSGPGPEELEFQRVRRQLVAAEQPQAGPVREPAHLETAGDTPRNLTSRSTTFQPDEKPWDFDGCEITSARERTRRSPMLSHETLPVSGASVVEMTNWVGQGQSNLPADVPGIAATSGRGGRLRPRSRLRQQPAEIFSTKGPSWRRRRNL
jgi:hypothetical protein